MNGEPSLGETYISNVTYWELVVTLLPFSLIFLCHHDSWYEDIFVGLMIHFLLTPFYKLIFFPTSYLYGIPITVHPITSSKKKEVRVRHTYFFNAHVSYDTWKHIKHSHITFLSPNILHIPTQHSSLVFHPK